jgi:hypothetical protein
MADGMNFTMVPASGSRTEGLSFGGKWSQHEMRNTAHQYARNVIYATDLHDGITRVTATLKVERKGLNCLSIYDHASRDNFTMGTSDISSAELSPAAITKKGKIIREEGSAHKDLRTLLPFYGGKGHLVMRGCEIANGDLPAMISEALPCVRVYAFYVSQNTVWAKTPNDEVGIWIGGKHKGKADARMLPDLY